MFNSMLKKLARLLVVVLAVTAITFAMIGLLPGNVAYEIAGQGSTMEGIEAVEKELGLDRPLILRYVDWLEDVACGNMGTSFCTGEPVFEAIVARLPMTLELMAISQFIALCLAVPLSVLGALKPGAFADHMVNAAAFAMISVPAFVMGLVLIYIFSIQLSFFPATGFVPLSQGILDNLRSLTLPALCLALVEWVPFMRVLKADMINTLGENYILTARAKGLSTTHILFRHALKPSSLTLITVLGIHIGHLIGGVVIVEMIFALPGIGRLFIGSIFSRDFAMVQGCVLFITMGYVGMNLLADGLYLIVDPRIRISGRT